MLSESPVLVVGVFRSGTSLLCSLLNQNPRIALMYECDIWNFPRPLLAQRFRNNWVARIEFFNQALSRHRLIAPNELKGLEKIRTPADLYRAFGALKGATVSGEKSPFYCTRLEQLYRQYPQASFILVWRDPAEVYRSVLKAGQTSRFFGKPGMLSRMIYSQEQKIRQSERIEKLGARVFRVNYAELVEHTEKVCRAASDFLGVPFDPKMLELNKADLSAIYTSPHHAYLRRGIIERQKYSQQLMSSAARQKLERFRHRWERLQAGRLNLPAANESKPEPGPVEFAWHNTVGRGLILYDSLVRAAFEFTPVPWLRVYRLLKNWVVNPPSGSMDEKTSMLKDCRRHWFTILSATLLLGLISFIHLHSNPHLMFILFYAIPCVLVTLVVNTRWATLFVVACSIISPIVQYDGDTDYRSVGVFLWNFFSRLILLEIIILTLGRIKLEFSKNGDHVG
jgi:Sulfotransferase family